VNNKEMFEMFRKVHLERGMVDEVIIRERWRLLEPFKGMNNIAVEALEQLMREYVTAQGVSH
jgi:hypothetical protein